MERTLAIIKPDAVKKNVIGEIVSMITKAGFRILGMKYTRLNKEQAGFFYEVHKERPFYSDLVEYMCSGPIVPIALEKENAIEDYRKLIGNTDPALAETGTVRKLYGESKSFNAVHGSDSKENGIIEIGFFFSKSELVLCD
ncbi:MAG: nucleoside-diphosphate kinase [Ignavibacteriae bacterium]|nr:nucleoside-diphosphate kinase [Ignavibacteriota bacterium]